MRKLVASLLVSLFVIFANVSVKAEYQCMQQYQQKIETFYPESKVDEGEESWVYKLKGYSWLTKVIGKPAAIFVVSFVPGAIPVVLTLSSVGVFFDILKNEKGIIGAYIILKMSEFEESEIANQDLDPKIEEEVLELKDNRYKREVNLFNTFVEKVNRKYKNSNFSYEEVRTALVEIATVDDQLCNRDGEEKLTSLKGLIRLTKNKLLQNQ